MLKPGSDADEARWVEHEELNSHGIYRVAPATVAVIEKALEWDPASSNTEAGGDEVGKPGISR